MNLKAKQLVDLYIGGPLVALLVLPVRLAGILLKRKHDLNQPRHILFIKLLGGGSLFLALPTIIAIRKKHPQCQISLLCSSAMSGFARSFGIFDHVRVINDQNLFSLIFSSIKQLLWSMSFTDTTIDLEVHSRLTTIYTTLTLAQNRVGFADHNSLWRKRLYTHVIYFNFTNKVFSFYDSIAALFGVKEVLASQASEHLKKMIAQNSKIPDSVRSQIPQKPFIALGVGCSLLGKERELSAKNWKTFLQTIRKKMPDVPFVFLGGKEDSALASEVAKDFSASFNFCGQLDILGSCQILTQAQFYIGIDSFLMHMGRALCPRVVGFWGPTQPATLLRPLPLTEKHFWQNYLCSPCIHRVVYPPCKGQNECMKHHPLDEAAQFVAENWSKIAQQNIMYEQGVWAFYPDIATPRWVDFKTQSQ